ncbi:ORF1 [Anelloviridae sp.]|nr:ORF1 [Anelloviridae sp.]
MHLWGPCWTPPAMALTVRRRTYYRRRRWAPRRWRRGYASFAGRFYRRRRQVRTKFRGPRRRRQNKFPRQQVVQWAPANRKKCTIRGWAPILLGTYQRRNNQWDPKDLSRWTGGGINSIFFTLQRLYVEHVRHRNYWTTTNDGTDLCRYKGMKLFLYPNQKYTYLITWDREYGTEFQYPLWTKHPCLALLNPQHIIVWSHELRGDRRPKKIWIPPPSVITNEWYFQRDFANYGLLGLTITLFDPTEVMMTDTDRTFKARVGFDGQQIVPKQDDIAEVEYTVLLDDVVGNRVAYNKDVLAFVTERPGGRNEKWEYWGEEYPYYVTLWGFETDQLGVHGNPTQLNERFIWIMWYEPNSALDPKPNFNTKKRWTPLSQQMVKALQSMGPFTQKQYDANYSLFLQYKSYWEWGGYTPDITKREYINPKPDEEQTTNRSYTSLLRPQVPVRNPTEVGECTIHPWDINRHGQITQEKWEKLIKQPATNPLHETLHTGLCSKRKEPWQEEEDQSSSGEDTEELEAQEAHLQRLLRRLLRRL